MPKLSSIASITCWYGKFPWYLPYFLHSCVDKRMSKSFTKHLMKHLNLFFILFAQCLFSQTIDIKKTLIDGEKAFEENNFQLAKNIYTEALKLNPKYRDFWYNLGVSELELGENDNACEHFYQAFLLNDTEALKMIKENCPNFRNGSIMSLSDVEEKPKFIYKGKEYLLFVENNKNEINPKYINFLVRELKKSRIIYEKANRRNTYVDFYITNADSLNIYIDKVTGDQKDAEIIKKEIISIFNKSFIYVSARNKGVNVDLWEKWVLPLFF